MQRKRLVAAAVSSVLVLLTQPTPGRALDTVECYGLGVSDFEMYGAVAGLGREPRTIGYTIETVLGMGLASSFSTYLGLSGSTDRHLGDAEPAIGFGVFGTPVDTDHLDVDLLLGTSLEGLGLGELSLTPSIELNLDVAPELAVAGLYLVVAEVLTSAGVPADEEAGVADDHRLSPVTELILGGYVALAAGHQLLAQYDHTLRHRPVAGARGSEIGAVAVGYNAQLTDDLELVSEVSFDVPQAGDEPTVQVLVGFVGRIPTAGAE